MRDSKEGSIMKELALPDLGASAAEGVFELLSGHFAATYVIHNGDGYVAYAKVFSHRPPSPWDDRAMFKVSGSCPWSNAHAVERALEKAQRRSCSYAPLRARLSPKVPQPFAVDILIHT